jgi:hypothetical protein
MISARATVPPAAFRAAFQVSIHPITASPEFRAGRSSDGGVRPLERPTISAAEMPLALSHGCYFNRRMTCRVHAHATVNSPSPSRSLAAAGTRRPAAKLVIPVTAGKQMMSSRSGADALSLQAWRSPDSQTPLRTLDQRRARATLREVFRPSPQAAETLRSARCR